MSDNNQLYQNLKNAQYIGEVIKNDDPDFLGRIKVKVFGLFTDLNEFEIPWCYPENISIPSSESGGSSYSPPKIGSKVKVRFADDSPYSLFYSTHVRLSSEVQGFLQSVKDAHDVLILVYDVDKQLQIFYTPENGFFINLKDTSLNITNENEVIIRNSKDANVLRLNKDGSTTLKTNKLDIAASNEITLTTPTLNLTGTEVNIGVAPAFSAVLAEPLWVFLKALSAAVDVKWPPTPGAMTSAANSAELASTSTSINLTA